MIFSNGTNRRKIPTSKRIGAYPMRKEALFRAYHDKALDKETARLV